MDSGQNIPGVLPIVPRLSLLARDTLERSERRRGIRRQGNRKSGRVGMAASPERGGDAAYIGPVFAGAQAVVTAAVLVMPDDAKGIVRREPFADLAGQDRALHGRDDFALERDHRRVRRKLADQLIFVPENRAPFLFELVLSK